MKLTSFLVLATFCATSAFGLNGASTLVNRATGPKGLANKNKPMVQAMDVTGNRLNTVVSQVIHDKIVSLKIHNADFSGVHLAVRRCFFGEKKKCLHEKYNSIRASQLC